MTIDSVLRAKVIELHLNGRQGRNQIARNLKLSRGSVTNILRANTGQAHTTNLPKASKPSQLQTSPVSEMKEKAQIPVSEDTTGQEPLSIPDMKGPDVTAQLQPQSPRSQPQLQPQQPMKQLQPESPVVSQSMPQESSEKVQSQDQTQIQTSCEVCTDKGMNIGINNPGTISNHNIVNAAQPSAISEGSAAATVTTPHISSEELPEEQYSSFEQWDSELWSSRIFREIRVAKKERHEELLLIEQKKQELDEERQQIAHTRHNIDQQRCGLEAREAKLLEVEPLIPSARQLRGYGITLDLMFPYMETLNEKAMTENTDLKTAAYNLTHDLREYRQLGSLHKGVEQVKQQLAILDAFTAQKQQAVTTLMNLQLAGFSEKEIMELMGIVNRWNKSRHLGSPDLGQGTRGSNMNASTLDYRLIGH